MTLRHSRGQRGFDKYPVIFTGTVTGVEIKFMSSTRRENRPTFIRTQRAFADAEEELRLTEQIENARGTAVRSDEDGNAVNEEANRSGTLQADDGRVETGTALCTIENSAAESRNDGDMEQSGLCVQEMGEEMGTLVESIVQRGEPEIVNTVGCETACTVSGNGSGKIEFVREAPERVMKNLEGMKYWNL